jgi:hypothetical protein
MGLMPYNMNDEYYDEYDSDEFNEVYDDKSKGRKFFYYSDNKRVVIEKTKTELDIMKQETKKLYKEELISSPRVYKKYKVEVEIITCGDIDEGEVCESLQKGLSNTMSNLEDFKLTNCKPIDFDKFQLERISDYSRECLINDFI